MKAGLNAHKLKVTIRNLLKSGVWVLVGVVFLFVGFVFLFWDQTFAFGTRVLWALFYWFIGVTLLVVGYSEFESVKETMLERKYPLGVWTLIVVYIVGGVLFLFGAVGPAVTYLLWGLFGVARMVWGRVWYPNMYVGFFCFLVAYGLWKRKRWGWALCLISSFISVYYAVIGSLRVPPPQYAIDPRPYSASGLVNIISVIYLMRSSVRGFFWKGR